MGRRANVNYWPTRGGWVDAAGKYQAGSFWTTIGGKQRLLASGPDDRPDGPTYLAALAAFRDEVALSAAGSAGDRNTVRVVIEVYLRDLKTTGTDKTFQTREDCLV